MKIVTFLLFLEIVSSASSLDFQNPNQDGVEYDDKNSPVKVTVDENNSGGKTTIVRITDAQGKPRVQPMSTTATKLAAEIQPQNSQYVLVVNRLDYESLVKDRIDPSFLFTISDSVSSKSLIVYIKNLDDESPTLEALTSTCEMQEESVIDEKNSTCVFEVSDPDGWLNSMVFKVTVQNSPDVFELKYETEPDDNLQKNNIYLIPKAGATFDYEKHLVYYIVIEAKDAAGHSIPQPLSITVTITDKPPVWTLLPSVKHVNEETETSFQITATDPDQDSPKELYYYLTSLSQYVEIDIDTGNVSVHKIDRESGITNISLTVLVHYRDPFSYVSLEGHILLLIDDIDDNVAKIEKSQYEMYLPVPENSNRIFLVNIEVVDEDVGENSAYYIDLRTSDSVRSAVGVSPTRGSGTTMVEITINSTEMDFSLPIWNSFRMELWTRGVKTPENQDSWPIDVYLEKENSSGKNLEVNLVIATILTFPTMIHII